MEESSLKTRHRCRADPWPDRHQTLRIPTSMSLRSIETQSEGGRIPTGCPTRPTLAGRWTPIPSIPTHFGPMLDFFERATCQPPTRMDWAPVMPRDHAPCGASSVNGATWLRKKPKKEKFKFGRFLNTDLCVLTHNCSVFCSIFYYIFGRPALRPGHRF